MADKPKPTYNPTGGESITPKPTITPVPTKGKEITVIVPKLEIK